jgi:hypothetical protein
MPGWSNFELSRLHDKLATVRVAYLVVCDDPPQSPVSEGARGAMVRMNGWGTLAGGAALMLPPRSARSKAASMATSPVEAMSTLC